MPSKAWVVKWNFARGFRAPTVAELSSNGAHEGSNRYEYGNTNLRSEKSWQTDLGVEWVTEHLALQASLFVNAVDKFIFYQKLPAAAGGDSLIEEEGRWLPAYRFNQRNVVLYGGELSADLHPHPLDWLHFENSLSLVYARFLTPLEGQYDVPFIPAARLLSQLRADIQWKTPRIKGTYLSIEYDQNFAQRRVFTAYDTETATRGYALWNASLGMEWHSARQTLFTFTFSALNIFDVAYQYHLSRLKYNPENPLTGRRGIFNMGRNFSVRVIIPLQGKLKGK